MSNPNWSFEKQIPGEKAREAMQGEFFTTQATKNPAEALVREAIQNSLDAGISQDQKIRIRMAYHKAIESNKVKPYFDNAWPHFQAPNNGLAMGPKQTENCDVLVIEDFGTTGLIGDPLQWQGDIDSRNAFYYFFRAEGQSGKSGESLGRWGVGKYVFPASSRAKSFFALTIRNSDSRCMLMGQAVLRSHSISGETYRPDGNYGITAAVTGGKLPFPVEEKAEIIKFKKVFGLTRQEEPGLSIVIPWLDSEIPSEDIIEAVVNNYFYPIINGKLTVDMEFGDKSITLDSTTIFQPVIASRLIARKPLIDLAIWGSSLLDSELLEIRISGDRPDWTNNDLSEENIKRIKSDLEQGKNVGLKVHLNVQRKNPRASLPSSLKIFMVQDGTDDNRTVFVREDIVISGVHAKRVHGVRSLVLVDDKALATLLGDTENPAHTEWQKAAKLKEGYIYGSAYLEFVTNSASSIYNILSAVDREEDPTLLRDFFGIPKETEPEVKIKPKRKPKKKGKETETPIDFPEPKRKRYKLIKEEAGFIIRTGDPEAPVPAQIQIRIAYDVRRGNALAKYDEADFNLSDSTFLESTRGAEIIEKNKNRVLLNIISKDFEYSLTGFDTERDLLVNVTVQEDHAEEI